MRTTILLSLATLLAAIPAQGQERREREERRVTPRAPIARAVAMRRMPRAVLGITTSTGSGLADTAGVLVRDVTADGPAARAGIRAGDRLTEIGGISLRIAPSDAGDPVLASIGSRRLTRELDKRAPGDEIALRVTSGSQSRAVRVRLADPDSLFPARAAAPLARARTIIAERLQNRASLGIHVGTTGSRRDTLGVFVMGVDDEGPAAKAGIVEGARIAAIDGVDLRVSPADAGDPMIPAARVRQLTRALRDVKPGDEVELRVWQSGQYRTTRLRTVPADSLRRNRRTVIVGDGAGWPDLFFGEPMPPVPPMPAMPPGAELEAFRFHVAPEFRQDARLMLQRARAEARRGAAAARLRAERVRQGERLH